MDSVLIGKTVLLEMNPHHLVRISVGIGGGGTATMLDVGELRILATTATAMADELVKDLERT